MSHDTLSSANAGRVPTWSEEEARLRRGICEVGRMCYDKGLIDAAAGNISARLADGTLLITPAGAMKGCMAPEHISHMDAEGRLLGNSQRASTETGMHLTVYRERPDVRAVLHCHPPHAVALTIAGVDLQTPVIPEIVVTIGGIPTAGYATPGTDELPESIRELVRCSDSLMLKMHGSLTLGTNLLDAFKKLDMLEHMAKILWMAHAIGHVQPLSPDAVQKLLDSRSELGFTGTNTLENRCGL